MIRKIILILGIFTVTSMMLIGCSTNKEIVFHNPENDIKVDYMEEIIQNEEKYEELYYDYASMKIAGVMSDELEQFVNELKEEKSEEESDKFADNGDKYIAFQVSLDEYKADIDEGAKTLVDNYLTFTRLGDETATSFGLSRELEAQDPVGRVKQYIQDENIKIAEIVFPENFEKVNYDLYPVKYTYRYILKGTLNEQPFEKEVVQDFYIGIDWSEGMDNIKDVIEYIREVSQ